MKLKDIAYIGTGLVLNRKKANKDDEIVKKYKIITLKSINNDGFIEKDLMEEFESKEELSSNYISQKGDIVVRLSEPNTAACIDKECEGVLIPSQFCLIRPNSLEYIPEYIAWYFNSQFVKKEISKAMIGSTLGIIKTGFINELELNKISIDKQKKIVEISLLKKREKELLQKLIKEKEILYETVLNRIYEEEIN